MPRDPAARLLAGQVPVSSCPHGRAGPLPDASWQGGSAFTRAGLGRLYTHGPPLGRADTVRPTPCDARPVPTLDKKEIPSTPTPGTPTPLTPTSDRDSSRDFTRSFTQIHAELRQDSSELQRQVLLWQRWIRYAAVLVAGISAVFRYGAGDTRGAWLPVAAAAALYFLFTALVGRILERTPEKDQPRGLPRGVATITLLADLLMVSALVYFSAPPSQFHR